MRRNGTAYRRPLWGRGKRWNEDQKKYRFLLAENGLERRKQHLERGEDKRKTLKGCAEPQKHFRSAQEANVATKIILPFPAHGKCEGKERENEF